MGVVNLQFKERVHQGSEMVLSELRKSVDESSYRPSIVYFAISLRFSEILPLLCSRTPLSPPLL